MFNHGWHFSAQKGGLGEEGGLSGLSSVVSFLWKRGVRRGVGEGDYSRHGVAVAPKYRAI